MLIAIAALGAAWSGVIVFALALCRAAARGDKMATDALARREVE